MTEHGMADTRIEEALRIEFQHLVTKHISNKMDGLKVEKDFERNQCQKLYTIEGKVSALNQRKNLHDQVTTIFQSSIKRRQFLEEEHLNL